MGSFYLSNRLILMKLNNNLTKIGSHLPKTFSFFIKNSFVTAKKYPCLRWARVKDLGVYLIILPFIKPA